MFEIKDNCLFAKFQFKNFREAFAFMTEVALVSEKLDHHPSWTNVWDIVEISLNTHSSGNIITEKDNELAKKIESIVKKYNVK